MLLQGDLVVLASGGAVPADCRINSGRIEVDQSGLTGESLPVAMVGPSGQPKMGSTVTRGEVEATVEVRGDPACGDAHVGTTRARDPGRHNALGVSLQPLSAAWWDLLCGAGPASQPAATLSAESLSLCSAHGASAAPDPTGRLARSTSAHPLSPVPSLPTLPPSVPPPQFTGAHTFFGKTAAMIQSVEEMSHFQKVLLKIMFFLLAISFVLCGIILAYLLARLEKFVKALAYVVVLLVASIPLAIEVVTTTTMAIGSRELALGGAIVARLAAIEELAGMNMLCSDKTGTLTLNKMVIQEETPIFKEGMNQYEVRTKRH